MPINIIALILLLLLHLLHAWPGVIEYSNSQA